MMPSTTVTDVDVLKYKLLTDLYFFTRYFYVHTHVKPFIRGEHFKKMSDALERVYAHDITRLIINMPPRFGKTEMAVVNFIAKGLAMNPASKYIHTSYSDSLALENSEHIRDLVQSDAFQGFFPITLKQDSQAKGKWYTEDDGGIYATSSGGQITGFGAGIMKEDNSDNKFGGAIIIDDPLKPEEAHSETVRKKINERFYNTILSRLNSPETPIIVIGQRLHKEDLPGKLLADGGWEHLNLKAIDCGKQLWDFRSPLVDEIKSKHPHVFMTQYQQDPQDVRPDIPWAWALSEDKHVRPEQYTPSINYNLDLSFDFNHDPCTVVIGQYEQHLPRYNVFAYFRASSGDQSALKQLCERIAREFPHHFATKQFTVTGDASGTNRDPSRPSTLNRYTDICGHLGISTGVVKIEKANVSHKSSRDLCNDVLHLIPKGGYVFWGGMGIEMLITEIQSAYPDEAESLNTAKKKLGLHGLDAWRYLNGWWFAHQLVGRDFPQYQKAIQAVAMRLKSD